MILTRKELSHQIVKWQWLILHDLVVCFDFVSALLTILEPILRGLTLNWNMITIHQAAGAMIPTLRLRGCSAAGTSPHRHLILIILVILLGLVVLGVIFRLLHLFIDHPAFACFGLGLERVNKLLLLGRGRRCGWGTMAEVSTLLKLLLSELNVLVTEDEAVFIVLMVLLLNHFIIVLNKTLLDGAPNMEVELAIFVVAGDAAASVLLGPADIAGIVESRQGNVTINLKCVRVKEPNLRSPVDA